MHLCVEVCGSDNRMDSRNECHEPINELPLKCRRCGFPDLDFIPQPYFVQRGRAMAKNEIAGAEHGHFFVREHIRRVIELVAPGQCEFYPTRFQKTEEVTPWSLAAPRFRQVIAEYDSTLRLCGECNQPRGLHPGTHYTEWHHRFESTHDLLTSSNWYGWQGGSSKAKWRDRFLFFSVRLLALLDALKAKGLYETSVFDREVSGFEPSSLPTPDDIQWVEDKLREIEVQGISLLPAGRISTDDGKWFRQYLKRNRNPDAPSSTNWKALKTKLGFLLPKSYRKFIDEVGTKSFDNVDEVDGFRVTILRPGAFDVESYRQRRLEVEEPTERVDAVMFAETDHGDCFCFDVKPERAEYEVYWFNHETGALESYAPDFAAFVRRVAQSALT